MKRLLVLALVVVFGALLLAGAMFPGRPGGFNAVLTGDATIRVHQWLDATFTPGEADILDYGPLAELVLGSLAIDSNAPVNIAISANWNGLAGWVSVGGYYPVGTFGDGTYPVKALNLNVNKDTPAASYTVSVTITITPTVVF